MLNKRSLPGLRVVKTVLAVFLSSLFMKYLLHQTPFFACIGAVAAMNKDMESSLKSAFVRNAGTILGGLIGILFATFTNNILLWSIGMFPLIMLHNLLGYQDSIVPGAIVYFAVIYLNTADTAWSYGLLRILGTLVGSAIALLVNRFIAPMPPAEPPAEHHHP